MQDMLERLFLHEDLPPKDVEQIFTKLLDGQLDPIQLTAFLVALRCKGESGKEIAAAAAALRSRARAFPKPDYPFADSCGTGGDGLGTINISSAVAFVAAACDLPVAKHGNRSVSSRSGSSDVLEALGVPTRISPSAARRCLDESGVTFLYAPDYHPGIAYAMPIRQALATRTMFNALGPLVNPAAPPYQLVGVYQPQLCQPIAEALGLLGCRGALVVHGSGLDEVALHGPTSAARLVEGRVETLTLTPEQAGLTRRPVTDLIGGEPRENAAALEAVLTGGGKAAHRDVIALNAGALLWVGRKAQTLAEGTSLALAALADGRASARLDMLREVTTHGLEANP